MNHKDYSGGEEKNSFSAFSISDYRKKVVWPGSTQLSPVPAVLVAMKGGRRGKNVLTVAWTGVACSRPPMLTIAVRPERYSYDLLKEAGCFSVNLPTVAMAKAVDYCGVISGRERDKFADCKFTEEPCYTVDAPMIAESPLVLECSVHEILELGSHHLFVAKIEQVCAAECLLDVDGRLALEQAGLLCYLHGHYFEVGKAIGHFGFSVRKKKGTPVRLGRGQKKKIETRS